MNETDQTKQQITEGKRAVVRFIENNTVVFESEGEIIRIPIEEVSHDLKKLIEDYRNWPGVLPGTEINVSATKCTLWHDPTCWAAYGFHRQAEPLPDEKDKGTGG